MLLKDDIWAKFEFYIIRIEEHFCRAPSPEKKGEYPTGEACKGPKGAKGAKEAIKETKPMSLLEEDMLLDLTYDELKQAFRWLKDFPKKRQKVHF